MELRRRGSSERLTLKDGMVFGRLPSCDVQVDDASVSRKHAQVEVRGGQYILVDLGSSNGIFQNGQRHQRMELRAGDLLTLGAVPYDVLAPLAGVSSPATSAAASSVGSDDIFEVPVAAAAEAPQSAYAASEAERARLRETHSRERRSRGLGDLSQQPAWLRWLIYAGCVGLMYGIIQGVRFIGGSI